jgi:hypothetical protein
MKIVKGKTEAEHHAEEQAQTHSQKASTAQGPKSSKKLNAKDVKQTQEALLELEETKGDFAKDH